MEPRSRDLRIYETAAGESPFWDWYESLGRIERNIVDIRLVRLRKGILGSSRSVGGSVKELKLDFGPGYRVYFGEDGHTVVVLLCGGDKSSQSRDIMRARRYWADYCGGKD